MSITCTKPVCQYLLPLIQGMMPDAGEDDLQSNETACHLGTSQQRLQIVIFLLSGRHPTKHQWYGISTPAKTSSI